MRGNKNLIFLLGIIVILLICQFIYFNHLSAVNNRDLGNQILVFENQTQKALDGLDIPIVSTIENNKTYSFQCVEADQDSFTKKVTLVNYENLSSLPPASEIVNGGGNYLTSLGGNYPSLYYGLRCNSDKGWVIVSGQTSKVILSTIDGETTIDKSGFYGDNGFFAIRGEVSVTCCRVNSS